MKIGVISYLLRHLDTPAAMQFLQDIGFTAVELDFRHADGLTDYHRQDAAGGARARVICFEHGIRPMAYCVGGLGPRDLPNLRRVFEFAQGLGVEVVVGVLDPAILPELDALCQEYEIYYAIENHSGNVFQAAETMVEAVAPYSRYIGFNPDTGHFAGAGLSAADEVRKLEGRIYHCHFKDSDQHLPLGAGSVDLFAVTRELKRQGYNRLWSIEHYEYDGISDAELKAGLTQALAYVRDLDARTR
ncbi:MAG: sugar phosphate isomerase/epimerase [Anaerolineales bacterium]